MSELTSLLLEFTSQLRLYHWQTKSYARHVASDMLLTGLNPLIDKFVEVYQGRNSRIYLETKELKIDNINDKNIIDYVKSLTNFLDKNLETYIKSKSIQYDTDLLNIRDEMIAILNQTLYLFTLN